MEPAGLVTGIARLVEQLGKMFNFVCENISDYTE